MENLRILILRIYFDLIYVVMIDEVDGMSGGDRGGVAHLTATIKNSHN